MDDDDLPDPARGSAGEPVRSHGDSRDAESAVAGRPWAKVCLAISGVVAVAGTAVVATLAATHKTAVTENGKAYVNGLVDGYRYGFADGVEADVRGIVQDVVFG